MRVIKPKSSDCRNQRILQQLCRGRDLLAEVRAPDVSVRDAAVAAGMSSFHFIRTFSTMFGETPHEFRTRERLNTAQRLLARGQSVTAVCLEVGFSSLGSFSTLFRRELGMSPAAYQRGLRCSVYVPDWQPHPPNCLLWMGGPDAIAIFEKTFRGV